MKSKKIIISALLILILCLQLVTPSFAASTTISFSSKNVTVGDSVTVTVNFSGKDIAGVQFNISYDTSILKYSSCSGASYNGGTAVWYDESSSASSHSVSFSFTANKTGSTTVQVSGVQVSDSEGNSISGFSGAAATLNVVPEETTTKAPETTTKKAETTTKKTETTTKKAETTTKKTETTTRETTTETTTKPEENEITLNGKKYTLVDDSAFVDAPDGFDETYSDYKGKKILTYTSSDQSQQIVCLMDEDGKKTFALFDDEKDEFSEYIVIKSAALPLILIPAKDNVVPDDFKPVNIKIKDKEIVAYENDEFKVNGLYLVYALSPKGVAQLYIYDSNDGTFQNYYTLNEKPAEPVTEPATEPVTDESENEGFTLEKSGLIKTICALAVLLIASIIAVITLSVKLRKRLKAVKDEQSFVIKDDRDNYTD